MKRHKFFILLVLSVFAFVSCNNEDNFPDTITPITPPLRDYAVQYNTDILKIETFLKTHSISVTNHAGFSDDQDVSYATVPSLDENSIWGSNPLDPKANLLTKTVTIKDVVHKIYYIKFRLGIGVSPTLTNQIKTQYTGFLIEDGFVFYDGKDEGDNLPLNGVITGWREILPEFKMGTITGVNQYSDFGAGVMFLPSALAYYNMSTQHFPSYSPLGFSFKLYNVF
jgi:hypothetical protein